MQMGQCKSTLDTEGVFLGGASAFLFGTSQVSVIRTPFVPPVLECGVLNFTTLTVERLFIASFEPVRVNP